MSYGAKAFSQVVKDLYKPYIEKYENITKVPEAEKTELLYSIYQFADKTLENSVENLQETILKIQNGLKTLMNNIEINNSDTQNSDDITNNNIEIEKE